MALRVRRDEIAPREDGFTLVEMVVTVTVIAVLFLSVAVMLDSGLRAMAASKARARGNDIATQAIEDLQRYSFNNLALCFPPTGTQPAGLEDTVRVTGPCNPDDARYEQPCTDPEGSIPDEEYSCVRNNITYTVKRYVAWVDALQTTKRLAVFVEWTDLVGNHQVSQQSSLRAPDQGAIIGLAPPTFQTAPTAKVNNSTSVPVLLTTENRIDPSTSITLEAFTTNLNKAASVSLVGTIPAHQANAVLDITVGSTFGNPFPTYNGYPVTIGGEHFTVIAGAGTQNWKVVAKGTGPSRSGNVEFAGDKVFASVQTIGSNDSPQAVTVSLADSSLDNVNNTWRTTLTSSSAYRFGTGSQYVSFSILRASDGKTAAAFATPAVQFCPNTGACSNPSLPSVQLVAGSVPSSVLLGSGGELQADLVVKAHTVNITNLDTVTVSFLTKAGSLTLALTPDGPCAGPDTMNRIPDVANAGCDWIGTLDASTGYRFTTDDQPFYFGAQQVVDLDPASVDKGSTAAVASGTVVFG
jgi:prepilin-type N-terminal cleavage/methylation domain-containing protein